MYRFGLYVTFAALAGSLASPAPASSEEFIPSLIPMTTSDARKLLRPFSRSELAPAPKLARPDVRSGHQEYVWEDADHTSYRIDAATGDIGVSYDRSGTPGAGLHPGFLRDRAQAFVAAHYPAPAVLAMQVWQLHDSSASLRMAQVGRLAGTRLRTLNDYNLEVRPDTGEPMLFAFRYRPKLDLHQPIYSYGQARALGQWALTQGKPLKCQVLLPSQFSPAQRQSLRMPPRNPEGFHEVELSLEEDPWLHQRLTWEFQFNVGDVELDAYTGQVLHVSGTPESVGPESADFWKLFMLPRAVSYPKPTGAVEPEQPLDAAAVQFNGVLLRPTGPHPLHYPPIVMQNRPLICAAYFPPSSSASQSRGRR